MGEVNDLLCSESILNWDARTMMPPGGADTRAKQLATLKLFARNHLAADETRRLLDAAEAHAAKGGFSVLEGYPIDTALGSKRPADLFTGSLAFFQQHGFEEVERRGGRPIVRKAI